MPNPFKAIHKKYKKWKSGGHVQQVAQSNVADSAATPQFQADPRTYILNHCCTLNAELLDAGDAMGRAFNKATHGNTGNQWEYIETGNTRLSAKLYDDRMIPGASKIIAFESTTGPLVTFLPWYDSQCTYILIDPQAELCLTGPLTGCHIFVATRAGFPVMLIHANANDNDETREENMQAKDDMAAAVVQRHGYTLQRRLARGDYEAGAFVWGAPGNGGQWQYYVHDDQLSGGRNTPLPQA